MNIVAAINNDTRKRSSGTEDTVQPTFHNFVMDAEVRIIRQKKADFIRTKQILEQADQQKVVPLTNTNKISRISTGRNSFLPFQDLSDGGAISTAANLLRKDLELRECLGCANANQKIN